MSVCDVIDTADIQGVADTIGAGGLGVLGSEIASSGTSGPGYAYNDLSLPADAGKEICGRITTWPSVGTLYAYEDTSFIYSRTGDGAASFQYQLYVDGIAVGTPQTVTLTIGPTGTASGATLTGAASITGGAATGNTSQSALAAGASLAGASIIAPGAAYEAFVGEQIDFVIVTIMSAAPTIVTAQLSSADTILTVSF